MDRNDKVHGCPHKPRPTKSLTVNTGVVNQSSQPVGIVNKPMIGLTDNGEKAGQEIAISEPVWTHRAFNSPLQMLLMIYKIWMAYSVIKAANPYISQLGLENIPLEKADCNTDSIIIQSDGDKAPLSTLPNSVAGGEMLYAKGAGRPPRITYRSIPVGDIAMSSSRVVDTFVRWHYRQNTEQGFSISACDAHHPPVTPRRER